MFFRGEPGTEGQVAPLVESGLHCGLDPTIILTNAGVSSPRSSRAGSIAARPGWTGWTSGVTSPRSSRAGSIAASYCSKVDGPPPPVAPLVESGLHCGTQTSVVNDDVGLSPRSSRAGSIAATTPPEHRRVFHRRPARRERAPLRHPDP